MPIITSSSISAPMPSGSSPILLSLPLSKTCLAILASSSVSSPMFLTIDKSPCFSKSRSVSEIDLRRSNAISWHHARVHTHHGLTCIFCLLTLSSYSRITVGRRPITAIPNKSSSPPPSMPMVMISDASISCSKVNGVGAAAFSQNSLAAHLLALIDTPI